MKRMFLALSIMMLIMCLSINAQAGTQTASMSVTGTVPQRVIVTVNPLDFGALAIENNNATTTITVNAPSGTTYRIALNAGLHHSGGTADRRMRNPGGNYLNYRLFKDAGHHQQWGDSGDYGNTYPADPSGPHTGNGSNQSYTVYGWTYIHAGTPAGNYSDMVTVTVHY